MITAPDDASAEVEAIRGRLEKIDDTSITGWTKEEAIIEFEAHAPTDIATLLRREAELQARVAQLEHERFLGPATLGGTGYCPGPCEYRKLTARVEELESLPLLGLTLENARITARLSTIAADERERCAELVEDYKADQPETLGNMGYKFKLAQAIRSLSDQDLGKTGASAGEGK